jgi:hypothetical protein
MAARRCWSSWGAPQTLARAAAARIDVAIDRVLPPAKATQACRILDGRGAAGELALDAGQPE